MGGRGGVRGRTLLMWGNLLHRELLCIPSMTPVDMVRRSGVQKGPAGGQVCWRILPLSLRF